MGWVDGVTVQGGRPDGTTEAIRFRLGAVQRLQVAVAFCAVYLTMVSASALKHHQPGMILLFSAFSVLLLLLHTLIPSRYGVTLTDRALVVHGRKRLEIPWTQIQAVTLTGVFGMRLVELHLLEGRKRRLWAPITGFPRDRDFQRKLQTIAAWWSARRGW